LENNQFGGGKGVEKGDEKKENWKGKCKEKNSKPETYVLKGLN
jgi:hypothetical protein